MESTFLLIIEIIGTFAFAISGIRLAAAKNFDWFGAYTVGLVTAIGGGTMRDVLLDCTPFWMLNSWYLAVTGIALATVILLKKFLVKLNRTIFVFDTIGLALFVVIGIEKSIAYEFPVWVAIVMGTMTGALGGVLRDILINEEPLIFRKDVYATACIAGGLVYWIMLYFDCSDVLRLSLCGISVMLIRFIAVRLDWSIPILRNYADNNE